MGNGTMRIAVFGANSGIAVATARAFAKTGARFVLVGRRAEPLEALAADLTVRGAREATVLVADLADLDGLPAVAAEAWERLGGLDLAFIAHGTLPDQALLERDAVAARQAIEINFISPALLANALAPRFEGGRSGTIAVVSSVAGERGRRSNYVYGAAKGGLIRFLEGLRHRLAPSGVQVLDIRPGFVSTAMTAHLKQGGPLWATPDRVADDIVSAVEKRRAVLHTPWFWAIIMAIVTALPRPIFHRTKF